MNQPKLWTKDFIMVSVSNLLLFISFYILMVTLTTYSVERFQASPSEAGFASSAFVLGAVLVRPIAGKMIVTIGSKKMLLFGIAMFFLIMLCYFPVDSLPLLMLIRFVHGFSFGIGTTATGTIAAGLIPKERRGEGLGYFATSVNLAMAVGPFAGLLISQYFDNVMVFLAATVLSVVALLVTLFLHVPTMEGKGSARPDRKSGFQLSDYFEKSTIPIAVLAAVFGFVYSSILSFLSTYAIEIDMVEAASFFFMMYAGFLLVSRPFTGRRFDAKGENAVVYPSIVLFGAGMLLLSQAHIPIVLLLAGAAIGVGFGTFQSSAQTIAVNQAPRHRIGLATSTYYVFFDFGVGVGPLILGSMLPYTGYRGMYVWMAAIVFVGILMYYVLHGKKAAANVRAKRTA